MSNNPPQQRQPSPDQQAYLQKKAREQEVLNEKLNVHVQNYPIQLDFPATVSSLPTADGGVDEKDGTGTSSGNTDGAGSSKEGASVKKDKKPLRTSFDFINYRLLETPGLNFAFTDDDDATVTPSIGIDKEKKTKGTSLAQTSESLNEFVKDLQSTNCYDCVQVVIGNNDNSIKGGTTPVPKKLTVLLEEKNWYKLYIGGGIKQTTDASTTGSAGLLPKVQFESSASLINLTGLTDMTQFSYSVDQTSTPTLSLTHTRPLYSLFDSKSTIGDTILNMDHGSKYGITLRADVDTLDFEHTRSSKDHVQSIGVSIANTTSGSAALNPAMGENVYMGINWSLSQRDVIPRRHKSLPYLCDASPDIIACAGPSWKHSFVGEYKLNGYHTDDKFNPTVGVDSYGGAEIAGPPGDVGFLKCWSGGSIHLPLGPSTSEEGGSLIPRGLSLHSAYHCGMLKAFSFGGLCSNGANMTNISDRYFVGGSHQLRGFLPAGIGPRADVVSMQSNSFKVPLFLHVY
jgi:hypothetical protein